ncbi:MAG: adenylate kinase [Gammaproteobacteria bacterium RIFCSPHIGHO2_12_FULL_42_10]|nr:MAG: adenylate kinase [Gammaproteobacteria bacterium RIFCSPHIGHO2_12_FULL_42_10]
MRLVLLGFPGAGKGTQAKFIAAEYHIPHISTGDILRSAIQKTSELGKKVKNIVADGRLVPDDIMTTLIEDRLKQNDCQHGFLLDGFPRTLQQASALEGITKIEGVIDIELSEEAVIERLTGRRIHPASGRTYHLLYQPPRVQDKDDVTGEPLIQRPDDFEATIRQRLNVYQIQTSPLKAYYQHAPAICYMKINGAEPIPQVKEKIAQALTKLSHAREKID